MTVDLAPLRRVPDDVAAAISGQERRASCDSVTAKTTPSWLYHIHRRVQKTRGTLEFCKLSAQTEQQQAASLTE